MRQKVLLLMCLLLVAGAAQAEITVDPSGGSETDFKTLIVSDLNSDPQAVEGINTGGSSSGVIAGLGVVLDSETFSFTYDAVYGWATADANEAIVAGTFLEYLDGLEDAGIGCLAGGSFAPDCKTKGLDSGDNNNTFANNGSGTHTPEALVISFDTSGLAASTTLTLTKIAKSLWTGGDRIDVAVYDASEGTVTTWLQTAGPAFLDASDTVVETGDLVIIGVSTDQGNEKWRIDNLRFEVDSLLSPYGAKLPDPAGPLKVIPSEPGDVTLSWSSPDDPNVVSVDNYTVYVGVNEPNLAFATPVDNGTDLSYLVSGLMEGDVVTWRVDTTVTVDSNDIFGNLDPQVVEGFPWSFTVTADGPVKAVAWDNNPNVIGSWPDALADLSVTVTDTGASEVTLSFSSPDPNITFYDSSDNIITSLVVPGAGTYPVKVSCDYDAPGDTQLIVEAVDGANPLDVVSDYTDIRVYASQCQASRLGKYTDGVQNAAYYSADIVLNNEAEGIFSGCIIDLHDFAVMAQQWLTNYLADAPFEIVVTEAEGGGN